MAVNVNHIHKLPYEPGTLNVQGLAGRNGPYHLPALRLERDSLGVHPAPHYAPGLVVPTGFLTAGMSGCKVFVDTMTTGVIVHHANAGFGAAHGRVAVRADTEAANPLIPDFYGGTAVVGVRNGAQWGFHWQTSGDCIYIRPQNFWKPWRATAKGVGDVSYKVVGHGRLYP